MIEQWIVQLRKGVLEYCLLLVLKKGAGYGYEIVQALKGEEDLAVGESTAYPILARLRGEGYLKSGAPAGAGGPKRRYYALTAAGKARLAAMEAYWPALTQAIEDLKHGKGASDDDK